MQGNPAMTAIRWMIGGAVFLVLLFLKLCFTTALYATLAEIHRRIQMFKGNRRPPIRALLLLPVVILFVTLVLFVLCLPGFFQLDLNLGNLARMNVNPMAFVWMGLRFGFLLAAIGLGALLGFMLGRGATLGKDRFGGILVNMKGGHLTFWTGCFAVAGFFRLMPWGFVTYWTVWAMVLSACLVAALHYALYGRTRAAYAGRSPGLPPGDPIDLELDAPQAAVLSALIKAPGPATEASLGASLKTPDVSLLAHPVWTGAALNLARDPAGMARVLGDLQSLGLAQKGPKGWSASGAAARLRALGFCDRASSVSVRTAGGAVTRVLLWAGPSKMMLEPGPGTLSIREMRADDSPYAMLMAD
jgi:hypothetical protein